MSSFLQICGVICEFNPFHNGHRLLLERIRASGGAVVAVMSGAFVQRGEPAVFDASTRARCALQNGADLVLELPAVWACANAEAFAHGGVAILNGLGCVDTLCYGSEHPDAAAHRALAEQLRTPAFADALQRALQSGVSFAAAREAAAAALAPALAPLLRCPNDILGVEYHKALLELHSAIAPRPFARVGEAHDSSDGADIRSLCDAAADERTEPGETIRAASFLRAQLRANGLGCAEFCAGVPANTLPLLRQALAQQGGCAAMDALTRALLARLRTMTPAEAAQLPDVSEGLEHRLLRAARSADSLHALYAACKTRRYAHARIRRIALAALLGITAADRAGLPPYARVLGLNHRGREILRRCRTSASIPIVMRPAELRTLGPDAQRVFALDCTAADLWALACPRILPAGRACTTPVAYIE